MKLNDIRDNPGARKKPISRLGAVPAAHVETGGRGVKGQKSRTGVSIRGFEGGQMPLHRRMPKRGFNNIFANDYSEVTVERLQKAVESGRVDAKQPVTSESLIQSGVASRARDGVRLIGKGELKAKLQLTVAGATKSAIAAVEKAGGSVTVTAKKAAREAAA